MLQRVVTSSYCRRPKGTELPKFRHLDTASFFSGDCRMVKVAVNTIVPRSPFFFVFVPQNPDCYTHQKKRGRISPSMEWRYLCYLQLVSKAKHPLTPMANEEVCPRDEIADPPGMAVLPIDIYGFDDGLVSFRTLCGVQSSLVRFAPNQAIDWGPLQWQAWLETLCLSSASS